MRMGLRLYNLSCGRSGHPSLSPNHSLEMRDRERQTVFCVGGGWVVVVEGVRQRTFQETQRHNLLIRGRLVQCVMWVHVHVCVCVCARASMCDYMFVCAPSHPAPPLLRPSLAFFSSVCLTLTFPALPYALSPFHHTHRIKIRSSAFRPH